MTARRIFIQHEQLSEEFPIARKILQTSSLMETFCTIDRGDYGFTVIGLRIMEVLELALSVFMETAKQMRNLMTAGRGNGFAGLASLTAEDIVFINAFSLYATAEVAMGECMALMSGNGEEDEVGGTDGETRARVAVTPVTDTFKLNEINDIIRLETKDLPDKLVKDYQSYLLYYRAPKDPVKKIHNIQDTLRTTLRYFNVWRNSLDKVVADSSYSLYREALEATEVRVLEKSFEGFRCSAGVSDEDAQLMKVGIGDVIGNKEYVAAAKKLALDVAGFDFSTWDNPKQVNPVLFALGNPGCGKTVTAHAVGNYFLDFCREHGIRARFVIIRRTDWASSYQNASANQLLEIFKRNVLDFKGVVGIYWPDIDTAFAARDDAGVRNEEKNILGAVFGLFDGTILPKNGQWFMLCDANYMNMDKATISRITQDPYQVQGPDKPVDFVTLLRDVKLRKHREFLKVTDEEWLQFGQLCIDFNLSGRSIENMSRKVVSMIEDFEYPSEYFKADVARKREIIRRYSQTVDFEKLTRITENYVQFEKEAEEKAARKRFEDRVHEITTYLGAERVARAALLGGE